MTFTTSLIRRAALAALGLALATTPVLASGWVDEKLREPDGKRREVDDVKTIEMPAQDRKAAVATGARSHGFDKPDIYERAAEVAHSVRHAGARSHVIRLPAEVAHHHEHDVEMIDVGGHGVPVIRDRHIRVWYSGTAPATELPAEKPFHPGR